MCVIIIYNDINIYIYVFFELQKPCRQHLITIAVQLAKSERGCWRDDARVGTCSTWLRRLSNMILVRALMRGGRRY